MRRSRDILRIAMLVVATASIGCDETGQTAGPSVESSAEEAIPPVVPESWDGMEPLVRERIELRVAELESAPNAANWLALGKAYHVHRYVDLARPCYEQSVRLAPDQARTLYYLAHVRSELGDIEGALSMLDRAQAAQGGSGPAFFDWRRGYWLTRLGLLAEAEAAFTSAIARDPQDAAARVGLARVAQMVGRHDEVVRTLLPIVEQPIPNSAYARHLLGTSLIQLGEEETGRSMLARQAQSSLSWPDAWLDELQQDRVDEQWILNRAQSMIRAGQIDAGLELLDPLIENYPDDPGILKIQGMAAFARGDMSSAATIMRRVVEKQPADAGAQLNLAFALEQTGQWADSITAARAAAELDPTNPHPRVQLGRSLAKSGNTSEGIAVLQALVDAEPEFATGIVWLGHAYADAGQTTEARAMLQRAAQIAPAARDVYDLQRRLGGS